MPPSGPAMPVTAGLASTRHNQGPAPLLCNDVTDCPAGAAPQHPPQQAILRRRWVRNLDQPAELPARSVQHLAIQPRCRTQRRHPPRLSVKPSAGDVPCFQFHAQSLLITAAVRLALSVFLPRTIRVVGLRRRFTSGFARLALHFKGCPLSSFPTCPAIRH
jgi:hypothetical protein